MSLVCMLNRKYKYKGLVLGLSSEAAKCTLIVGIIYDACDDVNELKLCQKKQGFSYLNQNKN